MNPSWRKIESALIELLREEGFELKQYKGDTYVTIYENDTGLDTKEICISDFAQQLEERIA